MRARRTRRGTPALLAVLVAALAAAAVYGWRLHDARRWNRAMAEGEGFERVAAAAAPGGDAAAAAASAPVAASATQAPGAGRVARVAAAMQAGSAASSAASAAGGATAPAWLSDGRPLAWRFAHAVHLAEAGDLEGALARYRSLYDDPALGVAARYNSGNALLREAVAAREAGHAPQALVLLELAKEAYRAVLRLQPDHWDARYNFERAQRLQPDPGADDMAGAEPPKAAERAATTMRGTSRGLP